jgi:hypothetical protein
MASKNLDEFKKTHYPTCAVSSKKRVLAKINPFNKRLKELITKGFISKTSGGLIMNRLCAFCLNYYHDPFNNVACPCQKCDVCNEKQKVALYTPYSNLVCEHL